MMRLLLLVAGCLCVGAGPLPDAKLRPPGYVPRFPVTVEGKVGYIDREGRMAIEPQFEQGELFYGGLAAVKMRGTWGFINTDGQIVIDCLYANVGPFCEGLARVQLDRGIRRGGESTGPWGYINEKGKRIIDCQYDTAGDFSEGLANVMLNGGAGYIDPAGKVQIELKYWSASRFSDGLGKVTPNKDGKTGFIDRTGKFVIAADFDNWAWDFANGLARVRVGGKFGFIDKTGKLAIPATFESAYSFSEGLACVSAEGKWGVIDPAGKYVGKTDAPQLIGNFSEGLARFLVDRVKYGYIDENGRIVYQAKFDLAGDFMHGMAAVKEGDRSGYIDKAGEWVWPRSPTSRPANAIAPQQAEGIAMDVIAKKDNRPMRSVRSCHYDEAAKTWVVRVLADDGRTAPVYEVTIDAISGEVKDVRVAIFGR